MVCSQVYSQHPSQCMHSNVHQHRSWVPSNEEVQCQEPATSEVIRLGNTSSDHHFLSSKGYPCSSHVNITSPFKSSWIQRLIPSHNIRVDQPQPPDKLIMENHGIDALQTNWKENADHFAILGNESDIPVYENTRGSKQDVVSGHLGTDAPGGAGNGVNVRPFGAPDALPPEIQVSPKLLPVVESLLPGHSKKVAENQTSTKTNGPHILSRCTGLANPMKQTVHCSADEKSRVSCSSIEGLNSHGVGCAAGDLVALNSMQKVKRSIGPSQPFLKFSFNSNDSVTLSNKDLTSDHKERRTSMKSRTELSSRLTKDTFVTLHERSRYQDLHEGWASSVARCRSIEGRLLDGYSTPYREEAIETDKRLPVGSSMNQSMCLETVSGRNCRNRKGHHSYAHDGSEALYAREGPFDAGCWSLPNTEKDEVGQTSNLAPIHCRANVAKEKADICSSHHLIEPDLGSSHGSYEEQGGTSRSFSFHLENRSAAEFDHSKVVTRKGQWPFGTLALWNEDLVQSRQSEDNVTRGLAEATRSRLAVDNSAFFQETGVCEAETAFIGRSQSSPFFGTENLNESGSRRVFDKHGVSPYKAACIDIGGVYRGQMSTEALPGECPLSRPESRSMVEGVEGKELTLSFPSRTVSLKNWKEFEPSFQCSPEYAQSKHKDGHCVGVSNWKASCPPIRSSTFTCSPEGAQLNHADGNLCCSTGSCKRPSNVCSEDPSTSADAKSRPVTRTKRMAMPSVARQEQLHSSQRHCASTAVDDRESEGKEVIDCEASALAVNQSTWIKRWSTVSSRKVQAVSRPNRQGGLVAGMTHGRNYVEDYCTSQCSREFSHCFDLGPAKRVCYEKRSDLHPEQGNTLSETCSVAVGREHNDQAVASHFMKRFFTPSAAAMAIMGMTARKVHATQPQRGGLFGVWASNTSLRKQPSRVQGKACKEFLSRPKCNKEISQSVAKAPPTSVGL